MNRTLILLLLFVLLGGGTFYLLQNKDQGSTTSKNYNNNFAVENIDEIQKIFIADKEDYRILLERKKDHWLLNKQFKAKRDAIDDLLTTIKNVQMKYTTPRGAEEPMRRNLAVAGIKVEIYGKNDKKLKTYYVGGSTSNNLGTYMIMEDATEPYVVHNPLFQGMLRGKYLKLLDDWKDLTLFGESVEEIQSVSVEYPKQRNKSFKVERGDDGKFDVRPFYQATPTIERPVQPGAIEKFLTGFSLLHAESYSNANPERDSIAQTVPFAVLSLTNTEGETKSGKLFPIIYKDEYGNPINFLNSSIKSTASVGRYYIDYNDGSFRMIQHRVFERTFWAYDHFFKP
ncbi:MAG: DUF4340 domain-containing protein [Bacteroidota bacterium]